jgi:hypothetical protein
MHNARSLILILLALTTMQCKKDASQVQRGYFVQMSIDGKQFRLTSDSAWTFNAYISTYYPVQGNFQQNGLAATVAGPSVRTFQVLTSDTTSGTYILDSTSSVPKTVFEANIAVDGLPYNYFAADGVRGISQNRFWVKINKLAYDYVEGEFGGELKDNRTNDTKIISKGQFRLPVIR